MFGLKPDHATAPPPLNGAAEEADEIFGFFFQFDVAVADNPEQARADQIKTGKSNPAWSRIISSIVT